MASPPCSALNSSRKNRAAVPNGDFVQSLVAVLVHLPANTLAPANHLGTVRYIEISWENCGDISNFNTKVLPLTFFGAVMFMLNTSIDGRLGF